MKIVKKLPTRYKKLGIIGQMHIYNIGGKAVGYKKLGKGYAKGISGYSSSNKWNDLGISLRKLGIEVNAGGNMFRSYHIPKNAFVGKTRSQIIKLQKVGYTK